MDNETQAALIGLWGVAIGAIVSLIASVIVPWIRDSIGSRRRLRDQIASERRSWLMACLAALLEHRQERGNRQVANSGSSQARFGAALNELTVRLTSEEQPVLDVLLAMFSMVQEPRRGVENMIGEAMAVLTLWARGDLKTDQIISETERRAGVAFSADRRLVSVAPPGPSTNEPSAR
ncbi:hypothetical protein L1277_000403 [Okibacterium sp. HSC-33S16]|uniref:hypothetical protein n=1 Tax=Okibacterium sp. HSC-33S16 TaxID=2910965 RepID=UPI0020A0775E|nr:hypothetical protein [Okibacterium sp. HSC-33S16]MCP2030339.1 hypothetical protein [Okibacterium sp. HSC-33S16]